MKSKTHIFWLLLFLLSEVILIFNVYTTRVLNILTVIKAYSVCRFHLFYSNHTSTNIIPKMKNKIIIPSVLGLTYQLLLRQIAQIGQSHLFLQLQIISQIMYFVLITQGIKMVSLTSVFINIVW